MAKTMQTMRKNAGGKPPRERLRLRNEARLARERLINTTTRPTSPPPPAEDEETLLFKPLSNARAPPKKIPSYDLTSPILSIIVSQGDRQKIFHIHESVLIPRSAFFTRAMGQNWMSGADRIVRLRDEDADLFATYIELLYKGGLPAPVDEEARAENMIARRDRETSDAHTEYLLLTHLYTLADFLADTTTKNLMLDTILTQARKRYPPHIATTGYILPQPAAIDVIYSGTPKNSGARRLLVELYDAAGVALAEMRAWDVAGEFVEEVVRERKRGFGRACVKRMWDGERYYEGSGGV